MARTTTNGLDLDTIIGQALDEYKDKCADVVRDVIKQTAKEATKELKKQSPRGKTKQYYKGWAQKVADDGYTVESIIYGKKATTYAIAHLLEHGHAKRGGGRVSAIPHIKKVQDWAVDKAINKIKEELSR